MKYIYLDNAATTPVDPVVRDYVLGFLSEEFGNPSSAHVLGQRTAAVIERARKSVAEAVGSGPWNVYFTSGGTEADNLALFGTVPRGKRKKVIISAIEHPAVGEACGHLESKGIEVVRIPAPSGVLDTLALSSSVDDDTAAVALIHVQNEIGTVQPIACASRMVREKAPKAHFHVDAVQSMGQLEKLDIPYEVDSVAVSGHKIHGLKGTGALLVRPGAKVRPVLFGGEQQDGLRPGTENVPGIAGMGKACELLVEKRAAASALMSRLSRELKERIVDSIPDVMIPGDEDRMCPATFSVGVKDVMSEVLLRVLQTKGVIASAGSACHTGNSEPSAALVSAGLPGGWGAVRFSLSRNNTEDEIEQAARLLSESVQEIRKGSVAV